MWEIYKGSPFNQPLKYEKFSDENHRGFFVPINRRDLVVRTMRPTPLQTNDERRRYLNIRADLWREFSSYEGVRVAPFSLVAGMPTGGTFNGVPTGESLYVVTEKVDGPSLDNIGFSSDPCRAEDFEAFCVGLAKYFTDKYRDGGYYLSDQKIDQYVYGGTKSNPKPGVHFVDLDWEMGSINPEDPYDLDSWMFRGYIGFVADMIDHLEARCGTNFARARTEFKLFQEALDV
ncbi:hypothetical protein A2688_02160 [Candidatus Daviesbacteria bacterium RIFCSPHIGHO2_01_FULL_38_8]|nr:MAG: hypothetical protein A2688_02160 [Candidatus Daviesbacteria bacterium RIFCSPHIGHO2_01_FULL_38_8]